MDPSARLATAAWDVWSTRAAVVVTDPAALDEAAGLVRAELDAVGRAASRFDAASELSAVNRRTMSSPVEVTVSPVLGDLLRVALDAARDTGGAVDPTLGAALGAAGYDADIAVVRARGDAAPAVRVTTARRATWRDVRLDGDRLHLPAGVALDLGATAKARTADRAAARVVATLGTGVLVALGGDVATAGPAPAGGWRVTVDDDRDDGAPAPTVTVPAGVCLATSSTRRRVWQTADGPAHHILDPATGRPATPFWRTVTVAATACHRANALSTAAVVRGSGAAALLRSAGAPARLVAAGGEVVRLCGWPA